MQISETKFKDVKIFEPNILSDERGFFFESFNHNQFKNLLGNEVKFVQDNHSKSKKNVLRGLHYQLPPYAQGKLIRVISGEIFDVAVDIRKSSHSFGQWIGETLSSSNKKQLWIPEGFAHGFLILSKNAEIIYKTNNYYNSSAERQIRWNDSELSIKWPLSEGEKPIQSLKDQMANDLKYSEVFD